MLPILQIGPLALPVPQFSLLLALWLGLSLAENLAPRRGISSEALYNLVFTGLAAGLIGARLGYVLQYSSAFVQSPLSLISLNPGLLDPFSGYGISLLAMLIYERRKQIPFLNMLDALTPLLAVLAVGIATAHIASGEAFGAETSLPWGINLWGTSRHPSQIYELAGALVIMVLTLRQLSRNTHAGVSFLCFVALTAGARLFLEAFRGDSLTIIGGLREMQIAAWLVLAAALLLLDIIRRKA